MYPVVALLERDLSQGTPKVVARHLFHVVELEELIPPVPIHVDEHVAVLVRREHLIGKGSGGKGGKGGGGIFDQRSGGFYYLGDAKN